MIALRLKVPLACWRKGAARELLETESLPPPATCYGALLSLIGESDRERHRGARLTAGLLNTPEHSTVLRTLWRIKEASTPPGNKANARPDFQQLVVDADLVVWCDSSDEPEPERGLETRVREALEAPSTIDRFGGWSLGESTHLINDVWVLDGAAPPGECATFLLDADGDMTLPVWVDHVGSRGTRRAVGRVVEVVEAPPPGQLPQIPFAEAAPSDVAAPAKRARKSK
jgi:CRISPR-associated protein Cas5t